MKNRQAHIQKETVVLILIYFILSNGYLIYKEKLNTFVLW